MAIGIQGLIKEKNICVFKISILHLQIRLMWLATDIVKNIITKVK